MCWCAPCTILYKGSSEFKQEILWLWMVQHGSTSKWGLSWSNTGLLLIIPGCASMSISSGLKNAKASCSSCSKLIGWEMPPGKVELKIWCVPWPANQTSKTCINNRICHNHVFLFGRMCQVYIYLQWILVGNHHPHTLHGPHRNLPENARAQEVARCHHHCNPCDWRTSPAQAWTSWDPMPVNPEPSLDSSHVMSFNPSLSTRMPKSSTESCKRLKTTLPLKMS